MRRLFGNLVSTAFSLIRFAIIKLFHFHTFHFYFIERFSPGVTLRLREGACIYLGKRVRAHSGTKICAVAGGKLSLGDDCRINNNCLIVCRDKITIGEKVEFGPGVVVYDHDHDFRAEGGMKARAYRCEPVTIGAGSWIGANVIILRGATIGKNCVIAAGSVVTDNVPDNTILVQKRENTLIPIDR